MSDNTTIQLHPFVLRLAGVRGSFTPELSQKEIIQMNEIVAEMPGASDEELSQVLNTEFNLQSRADATSQRESDIDEMVSDFMAVIQKWKILPMVEPQLIAGGVIHHLNGLSAVMGTYIENLYTRAGGETVGGPTNVEKIPVTEKN